MDAPRDLYLTAQGQLCEAGTDEAAFLFHRKGQTITPQEDTSYGVTAYLERTSREEERAERQRILAEAKAVEQATVEDKAVAGPEAEPKELVPAGPASDLRQRPTRATRSTGE